MPDRDDPTQHPQVAMTDPGYYPDFPAGMDFNEAYMAGAPQFHPKIEQELADADFPDHAPSDIFNENPGQFYTKRRVEPKRIPRAITLPGVSGVVLSGRGVLAGVSTAVNGNGLIILRDGVDASAPVLMVFATGQSATVWAPVNQWFGTEGLVFQNGLYIDYSQSSAVNVMIGALYVVREYAP